MNRPNVNERTVWNDEKPYAINTKYVYELEAYCDSLEKALDKACKHLSFQNRVSKLCWSTCPFGYEKQCKSKCEKANTWKEWAMKDE